MSVCGPICASKCWGHLFKLPEIVENFLKRKQHSSTRGSGLRISTPSSVAIWPGTLRKTFCLFCFRQRCNYNLCNLNNYWLNRQQTAYVGYGSHVTVHNSAWQIAMLGDVLLPSNFGEFLGWEKWVSETEAESQLPSQSVGKDFGKAKGLVLCPFDIATSSKWETSSSDFYLASLD